MSIGEARQRRFGLVAPTHRIGQLLLGTAEPQLKFAYPTLEIGDTVLGGRRVLMLGLTGRPP